MPLNCAWMYFYKIQAVRRQGGVSRLHQISYFWLSFLKFLKLLALISKTSLYFTNKVITCYVKVYILFAQRWFTQWVSQFAACTSDIRYLPLPLLLIQGHSEGLVPALSWWVVGHGRTQKEVGNSEIGLPLTFLALCPCMLSGSLSLRVNSAIAHFSMCCFGNPKVVHFLVCIFVCNFCNFVLVLQWWINIWHPFYLFFFFFPPPENSSFFRKLKNKFI